MRKSVLIMHGEAEREITSLDRSKQAGRADWQFDLISTNGGLDEEKREEEEVWVAATVSIYHSIPTSSKQASKQPWAF